MSKTMNNFLRKCASAGCGWSRTMRVSMDRGCRGHVDFGQDRLPAPNMLWVGDFTYVATWKGLVAVIGTPDQIKA